MVPESKAFGKLAGTVEAIYLASSAGKPMQPLAEAEAIAGQGLAGDRYSSGTGYYSGRPQPDGGRQITFIEIEELERLQEGTGILLDPAETRRNVLTRAIPVNDLIGERFRVGEVLCEGIRICEPCTYLEKLTGKRVMRPLVHRGGLRARIISGGTFKVGDEILNSPEAVAKEPGPAVSDVHSTVAGAVGEVEPGEVQAKGMLKRREAPSSEGGSHYLEGEEVESIEYLLVSEDLDLDDFLGIEVMVLGHTIGGAGCASDKAEEQEDPPLMRAFLVSSV